MIGLLVGKVDITVVAVGSKLVRPGYPYGTHEQGRFLVEIACCQGSISPVFLDASHHGYVPFVTGRIFETVIINRQHIGIISESLRRDAIVAEILRRQPDAENF